MSDRSTGYPDAGDLIVASAEHSHDALQAWKESEFSEVSATATARLLESGLEVSLSSGDAVPNLYVDREGPTSVGVPGLVVSGIVRVFVRSRVRQLTIRYAGAGEHFGIPQLGRFNEAAGLDAAGEAITDSRLLLFSPRELRELAESDLSVAIAMVHVLRTTLYTNVLLASENVLWPLKQRVARHLLDLAHRDEQSFVVSATVQDIANATGTVREVVTRVLREMRTDGLVDRVEGRLVLQDLQALHRIASGDPAIERPSR